MAEVYDPGRNPVQHPFQYFFHISGDAVECKIENTTQCPIYKPFKRAVRKISSYDRNL
jgi:hypothetical protein